MAGEAGTTTGFEFKLADGSVVKAENIEEAFKTIVKMKEDTAAALKAEREQREQLGAQVSGLQTELRQKTAPRVDNNEFNRDAYYKLVGEDPIMAQNYLDAYRFGVPDPAQVPQYFSLVPKTPLVIRPYPAYREKFEAGGSYDAGTPDGSRRSARSRAWSRSP